MKESSAEQLVVVLRRYREAMRAAVGAAGYRPIPPAANWLLLAIARQPGSVTDLGRRLGMAKQAVSRLADRLVTLGYCDRERSETNRRQVLLRPTREGAGAAAVLLAAIKQVDTTVLGCLDEREREAFGRTLGLLARPSGDPER